MLTSSTFVSNLTPQYKQAAGVIPVAHKSGGPLEDIIVPFNGERTGASTSSAVSRDDELIFLSFCKDSTLSLQRNLQMLCTQS